MSKASKKRRRAERAAKQAVHQFGFGRVLAQDKPKGFGCPGCGKKITFDKITLTMVLQGLPCCGYVLTKHKDIKQMVDAHREYREGVGDSERAWHRAQPKYETGGEF